MLSYQSRPSYFRNTISKQASKRGLSYERKVSETLTLLYGYRVNLQVPIGRGIADAVIDFAIPCIVEIKASSSPEMYGQLARYARDFGAVVSRAVIVRKHDPRVVPEESYAFLRSLADLQRISTPGLFIIPWSGRYGI